MAKVDGAIANLIQGVSQQAREDRREGQGVTQENMTSDVVRGLSARAATNWRALLMTSTDVVDWHDWAVGSDTFLVAIGASVVRVFNIVDGVEETVTIATAGDEDYFDGTDVASTVIDGILYLSNRTVQPAMLTDVPTTTPSALVQLLGGAFDRKFEVSLADPNTPGSFIVFSHTTGATNASIDTVTIATALAAAANALPAFTNDFAISQKSDVLLITYAGASAGSTVPIEITGSDGAAGALMVTVSERVNQLSLLPRLAPDDKVIKVTGLASAEEDDSYFRFDQVTSGFGNEGLWVETTAPGEEYKFDLTTMPHVLVRNPDMTFTFGRGNWENRRVGDNNTNPKPTFVGKEIQDVGSFQGRLVALTETTTVMTRTNKHLDYWKQSAVVSSLDDPIDMESTSKKGAKMRYLVPHNRDLVIFADKAQFIVFGRNALTPENASIVLTTEFETDLTARPIPSGKNIFFGTERGPFAGIREFFAEGNADVNNARPITAHVNKFIPGSASLLAASSNFDMLLVKSTVDPRDLYTYEFVWDGDQKLQSAWSKWIMPMDVLFMLFKKSRVHMIVREANDFHLIEVDMAIVNDTGLDYQGTLDMKVPLSTHTAKAYTLPYDAVNVVAIQGTGCPDPGLLAVITDITGKVVTLQDDFGANELFFGIPYNSLYEPTMPLVKDDKGVKVGTGTLTIEEFRIAYANSGGFDVSVTSDFYPTVLDSFSGRILADPATLVGVQPITSGQFVIYFGDNPDLAQLRIEAPDHTPLTIADIEWEGQWKKRGRRI